MFKRFLYGALGVVLLIAGVYSGTVVSGNQGAPAQPTLRPATLHEVAMAVVHGSQNIAKTTKVIKVIGIRADGTTATLTTFMDRALPSSRVIERPDGFHALIIDELKLISSGYKDRSQVESRRLRQAGPNCLESPNDLIVGNEVLHGQRVIVSQRTWADLRATMWNAPNLGCYTLRSTLERKENDVFVLVAENLVDALKEGEPVEQDLFVAPSDFAEVPPSEIYVRQEKRDRATLEAKSVNYWTRRDEVYYKERQNPPIR